MSPTDCQPRLDDTGSLGDMVGQVHWEPDLNNTHCGIIGSSLKTAGHLDTHQDIARIMEMVGYQAIQ